MILSEKGLPVIRESGSSPFFDAPSSITKEAQHFFNRAKESDALNFCIEFEGVNYRCAKGQTADGLTIAIRKPIIGPPDINQLGYHKALIKRLVSNDVSGGMNHGLVVFSGVTCSGKTTSAGALLTERLARYGGLAVTIEDPIELPLQGGYGPNNHGRCYQFNNVEELGGVGKTGELSLRFASPNIIFYGEIRDARAASEALKAALSGHLIITTIHSSGVPETLERLAAYASQESGESVYNLLANGLSCIIHQKLVPAIHNNSQEKRLQLYVDFLFANDTIRAKIRDRELHSIYNDMQIQKNKMIMVGL